MFENFFDNITSSVRREDERERKKTNNLVKFWGLGMQRDQSQLVGGSLLKQFIPDFLFYFEF